MSSDLAANGRDADITPGNMNTISSDPGFRITTSLRWPFPSQSKSTLDSDLLVYHQKRLLASAKAFKLTTVGEILSGESGLAVLRNAIHQYSQSLADQISTYKLTLSVSASGEVLIIAAALHGSLYDFSMPNPQSALMDDSQAKLYIARQPTAASAFTQHKTNYRPMYTSARIEAGIDHEAPTRAEVLLYNPENEVMEASVSTVYFWRDGQWVTPAFSCGGNLGSTRALALSRSWCTEVIITLPDVIEGEVVVLSNGVRGFWRARVYPCTR